MERPSSLPEGIFERYRSPIYGSPSLSGGAGNFHIYKSQENEPRQRHSLEFPLENFPEPGRLSCVPGICEIFLKMAQKNAQKNAREQKAGLSECDDGLKESLP
jgi:hypothetical protein